MKKFFTNPHVILMIMTVCLFIAVTVMFFKQPVHSMEQPAIHWRR